MDGRIREIHKSILDNGVSDTGVTVKKPKLELLPNDVAICSDVITKLNVSSPQIKSPDRARTVSSTDSSLRKTPHAFDFRFVTRDDEVRQILVSQTCDDHRDVTLISHPDDLAQANLVTRLSISDDGRQTLRSGKLFEGSQPFTLVLDIRKLTSEELPKFNDLLDPNNPCLYDKVSQKKHSLGNHVSLLVLADPAQLASVGSRDDAPGADFWRRINRPENTWQFDAQKGNGPSMDIDEIPPLLAEIPCAESIMDDDNSIVIDCHLHSNWRQLLLGGPGVDKQGRIQHLPGRLESLRSGQRVILKGADWQDLTFEQTIRQMLAQQCFESNGEVCPLPDDVQFYQMSVRNNELHSLFQSLSRSLDKKVDKEQASAKPIIINESNIVQWLNPIAIAPEGYAVPNTRLLEQVQVGGVVTLTSPLTEVLWFRLLGSLQTIRETTGLEPRLQVAHAKGQPKALGLTENDKYPLPNPSEKVRNHAAFDTVTYQQSAQANHWINDLPQTPLVIQVNEQTSFSQLFDNIHITSEQKAHFGHRKTKLQEALTAGKPVVLRGLESNPTLQQLLEPLVVGQPLLVNGQLQAYPDAHVTMLWPESVKSPSSVFRSMVATSKPCPEVDLWDINAVKHEISRTELPEQALNELYQAFKTVPAHLCNPLPEVTEELLNSLILAARRAQQVDQSLQLLPCHWRKAIDSVITHGTRQHPPVRDFMKVACQQLLPDEHQIASVDPDRINAIINSALPLDRAFVGQNLWSLARAFDPVVFNEKLQLSYKKPFSWRDEKETLDRLCALIVAHAPGKKRDALAYQLKVDPAEAESWQSLAIRPTRQIKRLQDALASGWQLILPPGQTRSDTIRALASDCFHRARTANSKAEDIERIEHRLSESLQLHSSADKSLSALAQDLYHGEMSQKDRESRRLSRLHDRLTDSPVIFLQGETGTGKSYFSAKMAKASGQASVISLGPSDSDQTLMKRWQWQQHADGDRSMMQQNRALMEWAKTKSDKDGGCAGGEYITLVLDEANLTKAGLLASLNGLWEREPCIYVNGHPVRVSSKHRVILTGNPDHYAGRQMDPALKEKLPRAYYPRLDQAFLRDRVVEPALVRHLQEHLLEHQINDFARSATKSVMALWQHYQELLPEHEFTPRDLTDICSWVGWYLDRALPARGSVTCEQINSLIQQSFRDVLGPEITETHQDALSALEIWFAARYQPENTLSDKVRNKTLSDIHQTFSTVSEKIRPDFDTSGSAVRELVQQLGQDLSRCQQAYHLERKHGGRQATLIEGPAGRGKDATLNLVIESVKQQAEQRQESMPEVFYLNACDCSWDKVCETIQKAKVKGGIVVISEMNLIDSQHLEGELNHILAGDAHPGFHLFATINPPEYSGRKPLSPALKGRFRHLPIRQYNPEELQTIAEKALPESSEGTFVAKKLTEKHCLLRAHLQRKKLPLRPTSLDLQNVARAITRGGDFSEKAVHQNLNQYYRLYLMAANLSLEELPGLSAIAMDKEALHPEMSEWFYQTVSGINRPWLIRGSHRNSLDEKRHEIRFNTRLDKEEAKTEIIKRLAQSRWRASGLTLKPDQSDDIFTQVLYRHWQQCWFTRVFARTEVDANSVFPLTKEQAQTLKMPAYQPYLEEADKQIQAWKARDVQCWPGFWHQISALPDHLVNEFINEASAISGNDATEPYDPEVEEEEAPALDQITNYEDEETPKVELYKIFDSQHPPEMYRWRAVDIRVTARGEIKKISLDGKHLLGVETLTPRRLSGNDYEMTLTRNQTLATLKMSSQNGQYPLPSLTASDSIVALRIEPYLPHKLIRDTYTGLHTLLIPQAEAFQSFQCTYVVEPAKPGKKTGTEATRTERSIHFDVDCTESIKSVMKELLNNFNNTGEHPPKIQALLQTIASPEDTRQRINAITEYCEQFSGEAKPGEHENFFEFLVTKRQGSCRHRVPVFIAFCRYFGIPCRQIDSLFHCFPEYSVDGGQTWESVDLGGAPGEVTKITPDSGKFCDLNAASKHLQDLLEEADSEQIQALARAFNMSLEQLKKAVETGGLLPFITQVDRFIIEIVKKLWVEKSFAGFSLGVSLLESLKTEALDHPTNRLLGRVMDFGKPPYRPMPEAVIQILSDNDEVQVTEPLRLLHSKMVEQNGEYPYEWLRSMVDIVNTDLARPSFIRFAREALLSGWLDPVSNKRNGGIMPLQHHELLVRLVNVDELKVDASHCLKKWYKTFFSRGKDNRTCNVNATIHEEKKNAFFVTHCHDGRSSSLEGEIANPSIEDAWTDQPEGIPNIERILEQRPAFPQLTSGKANHRPVILMGQPAWNKTVIEEKAEALYQRKVNSSPNWKQVLEMLKSKSYPLVLKAETLLEKLKKQCKQAIQQAFCHYLYEVTHSKGGCLSCCWAGAFMSKECGTYDPSSPVELYAMLHIASPRECQELIEDAYLRQAHNASNALVLKNDELTKIAGEFLSTVNLNSIYESLDT
ncbi:AAA family ATPase [Endozoicomonas sp. 8E]|uniref:AAA family ATPase n=1 Tax=Endozoicomonas sp. 8E TaxID=3035692 RepID=UPI002939134E|nr:AAA family ATPase [Endozoicomonas sp. 8E]WOG28868.1 AAA family ATPase [Endozoicomonas sp. 8E]